LKKEKRIEAEAAEKKRIERERLARLQQSLSTEELQTGIEGLAAALGARVGKKNKNR
jgi:hypothetical protein